MYKYIIIVLVYIISLLIYRKIWSHLFTPKKSKKKSQLKNLKSESEKFNKRKERMASYKSWSATLNKLPVLKLTEEKKKFLENSIDSKCNILGYTKPLAEELHCQQWLMVLISSILVTMFISVLGAFLGKVALIGLFGYIFVPVSAKMVLSEYEVTGDKVQSDIVEKHFSEFFEEYYIQYQVQKPSLELSSVLKAYSSTCCPDMILFCSTFMSDIRALGPEGAIQMLSVRYKNSNIINRFSAIAQAINIEEPGANEEVESFLDNLMTEQYLAQEKNLEKQDSKLDREITITIGVLLISLVTILLINFKNII